MPFIIRFSMDKFKVAATRRVGRRSAGGKGGQGQSPDVFAGFARLKKLMMSAVSFGSSPCG